MSVDVVSTLELLCVSEELNVAGWIYFDFVDGELQSHAVVENIISYIILPLGLPLKNDQDRDIKVRVDFV